MSRSCTIQVRENTTEANCEQLMRGSKPIPTDLHKLRGTLNATRHGKGRSGEPEAESGGEKIPHGSGWVVWPRWR